MRNLVRKQLTKKQLYGYSYMKWDMLRKQVRELFFGYCSFCYDAMRKQEESVKGSEDMCNFCLIDRGICGNYGDDSAYQRTMRARKGFSNLVGGMCVMLARRYYNEEE